MAVESLLQLDLSIITELYFVMRFCIFALEDDYAVHLASISSELVYVCSCTSYIE